jgi:hypothetical protein
MKKCQDLESGANFFLGEQIVQLCENFVSTVCNSDFA